MVRGCDEPGAVRRHLDVSAVPVEERGQRRGLVFVGKREPARRTSGR